LCFDVGANVGEISKIFLSLGAHVVAVEPQDSCLKILKTLKNEQLTVVPKALGEKDGQVTMMIADSVTLSSLSKEWVEAVQRSGRFATSQWAKTKVVPMTTTLSIML
jgi:FkbM family methyltransferase